MLEFFRETAGFDVGWSLISFQPTDSYGKVFIVGILNTLLLATIGVCLGGVTGIAVGLARASSDAALRWPARAFTECTVNTPFVLQVLAWYFGIFSLLPAPRDSLELDGIIALNNRGMYLAKPVAAGITSIYVAAVVAFIAAILIARRRLSTDSEHWWFLKVTYLFVIGIGGSLLILNLSWDVPRLQGFNFVGGIVLPPSLCAITCALVFNNAAYVGEIIRSGLAAVPHGQTEAGLALGLRKIQAFRLVVLPQVVRIVVPPLISQSQDVLKNCSLSIAVGFPDLVNLWMNVSLNQSGRATEIILTTMMFYLLGGFAISLALSSYRTGKRTSRTPT
jgi:general L-amino acid transport system permease protein